MGSDYTFYSIIFNTPDLNHNIYTRESVDIKSLEKLKEEGEIVDFSIDSKGVLITQQIED